MNTKDTIPPFFQVEHARHGIAISGLTAARAGLYDVLKLMYWQNNCSLPFGKDELHRLKRKIPLNGYEDADLIEVLDEYFPDGRHEDLDMQRGAINSTRAKAKAAANKRWSTERVKVAETVPSTHGAQPAVMFDQPPVEDPNDF